MVRCSRDGAPDAGGAAGGDALVLVDLDFFKTVNDTQGHQHGDQLPEQFAQALQSVAREADCAARYGGEEFVLFLPGAGARRAVAVVERLRRTWAARQQGVTFSAGVAEQEPRAGPVRLLQAAR